METETWLAAHAHRGPGPRRRWDDGADPAEQGTRVVWWYGTILKYSTCKPGDKESLDTA